jgi:hypothetical protein
MKVLVMMECSGRVRDAFIACGHDAISCDIQSTEVPGPHSTLHWWEFLERYPQWDIMIAHPPCTYLAVSGNRWLYHPEDADLPISKRRRHPKYPNRIRQREDAVKVVETLWGQKQISKIAIENPIGRLSTLSGMGKPAQIIQPWMFGHGETKATCLWLKNLPALFPTDLVVGREQRIFRNCGGKNRQKDRSRTFLGIAIAMATQWGGICVRT